MNKKILITGGAGFIGSALIRYIINETDHMVINVDKLTYAGSLESLISVESNQRYIFEHADICDAKKINQIFKRYQPDLVMHLAAESHVDKSIESPEDFLQTNILGTYVLLEEAKKYWLKLGLSLKDNFRFHHISTDEVYGDLELESNHLFTEETSYDPSSPYSSSKASSDHLVRAWNRTYGLPVLITNCSNNYGPFQFPEKLIPLTILNAITNNTIKVYGSGHQVRDWLFVDDHACALTEVLLNGRVGETYNIGGHNELRNIDVIKIICGHLESSNFKKHENLNKYEDLIEYTDDRPGQDQRYAIDASKIQKELGWFPKETFETGIQKTVDWYLQNLEWLIKMKNKS